jgi:hypothetical protein
VLATYSHSTRLAGLRRCSNAPRRPAVPGPSTAVMRSGRRARRATRWPSAARARAVAVPMPRDPPVGAATPSFDVAVTHTDQASVIGMPQPSSVMVSVSGSGPLRFPVSRAASCSEVSSKSTSKFSAIRAGLVALGIAERPALVPEMDALAGDAELAGHLGLTDAGGEQLGGGADGLGAIRVLVVPQDGEQSLAVPDPDRRDPTTPTQPSDQHPEPVIEFRGLG